MGEHTARLTSAEIGGLWSAFFQENMAAVLLKYFIHHNEDKEIGKILENALLLSSNHTNEIASIFAKEEIPLPVGFTDDDIDLNAPRLFYDPFALTFVYSMSRLGMVNNSFTTVNIAREDVLHFFVQMLKDSIQLYQDSVGLMLSKGIHDRPMMIPYPKEVEYLEKESYILGFGKKRPLNAMELTEIFFNTERNYFSIQLCMALLQIVKDKEIHAYIQEGKKISESQINTFNSILMREELLGNVPMNIEVTDSTVSPFSDKLIVMLFHTLNSIDITLLGHALSMAMRTDLAADYQKYILEVLAYAAQGFNILVERGWMLKPPHAPSRRDLQKLT